MTEEPQVEAMILKEIVAMPKQADHAYHEFLRISSMSAGLYALLVNTVDPQTLHTLTTHHLAVSLPV